MRHLFVRLTTLGPACLLLVGLSLAALACQPTPASVAPSTAAPSPAATTVLGAVETLTPVPPPATATLASSPARPQTTTPGAASGAPLPSTTVVPPTATTPPSTANPSLTPLLPTSTPTPPPTSPATPTATATATPSVTPTLDPKALLAQAMLLAMNAERARSEPVTPAFSQGIAPARPQPLAWDERVARVADAYARDMATRNFFSHTSPEGQTPQDRLRDAGIDFTLATENIYMAREPGAVETAMTWFMQDQLHRDSILNPRYNRTGIGVYIQDGMVYFVQMFITAP